MQIPQGQRCPPARHRQLSGLQKPQEMSSQRFRKLAQTIIHNQGPGRGIFHETCLHKRERKLAELDKGRKRTRGRGRRKEGGREEGGQASSVRPKAGGGGVWRAAEAEGPGWALTGQQVACDWAEQQHGPRGTTEQPLPNRGFVSEDSDKVAIPGASGQKTQCEPRVPKAQQRYL